MRLLKPLWKPGLILLFLLVGHALSLPYILWIAILLGSLPLLREIGLSLLKGQFVLDYIALAAIITAVALGEYLVAGVIALMLATGAELEHFGTERAKEALSHLLSRIPHSVTIIERSTMQQVPLDAVAPGTTLLIKKGEMIPVDGTLLSEQATIDQASLTGEPYPVERKRHALLSAGTLNIGESFSMSATGTYAQSGYARLISMVEESQKQKPPLIRLADQYSTVFTLITAALCGITFAHTQDWERVLAVLVLATPCPLILAAPIAFIGGINTAAKQQIIIKQPGSLEVLARCTDLIVDKTGTLTIGTPHLVRTEVLHTLLPPALALKIAASLEQYSLHPFAKALLHAHDQNTELLAPTDIHEIIGTGIEGTFGETRYRVQKTPTQKMAVDLCKVDGDRILPLIRFYFEDTIKKDSKGAIMHLLSSHLTLHMLTGDKKEEADRIMQTLHVPMEILAETTPTEKRHYIEERKKKGATVLMVGDGINDAPALAEADVSMAFSPEEQTAATDAADIVLLGTGMEQVHTAITIARTTIRIAKRAMLWGISLSLLGMLWAAWGHIPPLLGAVLQELIDVIVIMYALYASTRMRLLRG